MEGEMRSLKSFVLLSLVFSLLCLTGMAFAQKPDRIIGMTLETNKLSLEIGESYKFMPDFQTVGEAGFTNAMLHIYSSDENVAAVATDPEEYNTITAVGGGSAKLFLFSAGYEVSAVCSVTVTGPAIETYGKNGSWNDPTAAEMKKLLDPGLKAFFEMLVKPEMANAAPALAAGTEFNALVTVSTGKADDMAALAEELGMSPVYAFPVIDTIGVTGTADQYLALLKNKNILFVIENKSYSVNDSTDRHMFEGQSEALSHISAAREAGMTGDGTVIAILDTGVDENHEQFTGKPAERSFIAQACFSASGEDNKGNFRTAACANGKTEDRTTSAIGSQIQYPGNFEHGTHAAAIAAGKDGVAPGASIIAVNVFYEDYYYNDQNQKVYGAHFSAQELFRAFEYLADFHPNETGGFFWDGQYYNFASINMSIGEGQYKAACTKTTTDNNEAQTEAYFAQFLKQNIIPVVSSGNNGYDKAVNWPACAPSAFTVGALQDSPVPEVADYSNHSSLVDIMAPGTQIYSAVPNWNHENNSYEARNGTSMAAPFVSGSFALMREILPELNAAELQTVITGTTTHTAARAEKHRDQRQPGSVPW